jgi:hypothetical protein
LKDAPDHLRLGLYDNAFAVFTGSGRVSVRQSSGRQALLNATCQAPTYFMSVVLAIELSDQAAKADEHGVDDLMVQRESFICRGLGWVCENYPDRPWTDDINGCQYGAGMPCECQLPATSSP